MQKKDAVLGLATGSSPVGLYKEMIQYYKDGYSYKDIKSYNLDEYVESIVMILNLTIHLCMKTYSKISISI